MTLKDGLTYLQYNCCEGGLPMQWPSGPCGDHFSDGTMCATGGAAFQPMRGTGQYHCNGDEDISMAEDCVFEGHSGWDESADEKCDIERMNFEDDGRKMAACNLLGSWEEVSCLSAHGWLMQMMNAATDMCTDGTVLTVVPMFAWSCCVDQRPITEECASSPHPGAPAAAPGMPTQPAIPDLCMDMTQFTPQVGVPGTETCKGDEEIIEKSKCMPFGREDAWESLEFEKCDVTRMWMAGDDYDLPEQACLELGGSWEPMKCQEIVDMLPNFFCMVGGFETSWNMVGGSCCGQTAFTPILCPEAPSPGDPQAPSPGGSQGQCGQVSQAAINSARTKGYEPRYC